QTTETRVVANVIRRRTAREVLKSEDLPPPSSTDSASSEVPPALDLEASVPPSLAEVPPARRERARPVEEPPPAAAAPPPAAAAPAPAAEQPLPPPPAAAPEPAAPSASSAVPAGRPRPARQVPGPVPAPPPPGFEEMRGVKVLGKIDLRKPTAPAPSPAARGAELARAMGVKAGDVLKKLLDMGMMATINQALDHDTAVLVAAEFEHQVENVAFDVEQMLEAVEAEGGEEKVVVRAPVVTMMGHVD